MPELMIPCPFCGSTEIGSNSTFGTVWGEQCTRALKIAEWQSRPIEDALRAEVERLNGRFDTANQVIAHRENECAMLRAEVAALQADCRTLETAKADAEALAMSYEGTAERLQAELAKYTEPLTDEQIVAIEKATAHLPRFGNRSDWWDTRDAAIRRVRRGE